MDLGQMLQPKLRQALEGPAICHLASAREWFGQARPLAKAKPERTQETRVIYRATSLEAWNRGE